jgi:putative salt-induced outer membrane protein YdiY
MRSFLIRPYAVGAVTFCLRVCWLTGVLLAFTVNSAIADELIMKNGDRLQGKVLSMSLGKLVFESPYAGKITISWDHVDRLSSDDVLEVTLQDNQTLKGKAVTAADGTIVLKPETGPVTKPIAMAEVKTMSPPKPPEGWKFTGRVGAGVSKTAGNTDTQAFNLDGQLGLAKHPHRFSLYGETNQEKADGEQTVNNSLLTLDYDRFVAERFFLFGNGRVNQDKFQDLRYLGALAAGAGYQFWQSEQKNLTLKIGPSYVWEKYTAPQKNFDNRDYRDYFAGFWAIDFDIWFFDKFMQFFHHDDGFLDLEETDVWRIRTRTGLRIPIAYKFFTSLQYNYDWVNSTADGKKNYDSTIMFKLGWEY